MEKENKREPSMRDNSVNLNYFSSQLVESVWSILKSNVNLAFTIVTTVLSMIFFSSTYVLNTGLSSVRPGFRYLHTQRVLTDIRQSLEYTVEQFFL